MAGEACVEERHDHRNLLRIIIPALPIKTDKSAAPANLFLYVHIRVNEISQVADDNVFRFDARIFENIELLERRFPRNSGVSEDRNMRRDVSFANSAEHLSFIGGDLVPRSNLAKHADHVVISLLDERADNLILAHGKRLANERSPRIRRDEVALIRKRAPSLGS